MKENIYYIKKSTQSKTIHIKELCSNSKFLKGKDMDFYTLNDVYKEFGNTVHMCMDCETEKERIIHEAYVEKLEGKQNEKKN